MVMLYTIIKASISGEYLYLGEMSGGHHIAEDHISREPKSDIPSDINLMDNFSDSGIGTGSTVSVSPSPSPPPSPNNPPVAPHNPPAARPRPFRP
jgi:hypothetical protein